MLSVADKGRAVEAMRLLIGRYGWRKTLNAMLDERGVSRLYHVPQNEWPQFVRRIAERLTGRKIL